MKFTLLPYKLDDLNFFISPFTGNLVVSKSVVGRSKICSKTEKNIWLNNNPYQLKPLVSYFEESVSDFNMKKLNSYNNKLTWLGNRRFLLSCLYSRLSIPLFENTIEAFV